MLTLRPVVGIGLISYSLYLVHQPVFALLRIYQVFELDWLQKVVTLLCCIGAAYISWRWIEQPFRAGGTALKTRKSVFLASGGVLAISVVIGLVLNLSSGWPQRFGSEARQRLMVAPAHPQDQSCLRDFRDSNATACALGAAGATKRIAIIGDSHAWHLLPVLREIATTRNWRIDVYAKSACPPWGPDYVNATIRRRYAECAEWARGLPLSANSYDAVLLTASSAGYRANRGDPFTPEKWEAGLSQTFARLRAARLPVIWAMDTPRFKTFDPLICAERAILFNRPALEQCRIAAPDARDDAMRAAETRAADAFGVKVIDLSATLCDKDSCTAIIDGMPAMRDSNHIVPSAAQSLRPLLEAAFESATRPVRQAPTRPD